MGGIVQSLRIDLRDFGTLSPQVRFLLVFQMVILFSLSILIGVIFSPKFNANTEMRSGAPIDTVPTPTPKQNILSLVPDKTSLLPGESTHVEVVYLGDMAEVIDTAILYDPATTRIDAIKNGPVYDKVLQNKKEIGRIYFSAGFGLAKLKAATTSSGVIYSFDVKALKEVDAIKISFVHQETFGWHNNANIITKLENAIIDIEATSQLKPASL